MHAFRIRYHALFVLAVVVAAGVIAAGVAAALSHQATNRRTTTPLALTHVGARNDERALVRSAFMVVAAHAGSLDTGSGSATRQGYTTYGPAKPGDSGSLNAVTAGARRH
jgi:hypothetical protein